MKFKKKNTALKSTRGETKGGGVPFCDKKGCYRTQGLKQDKQKKTRNHKNKNVTAIIHGVGIGRGQIYGGHKAQWMRLPVSWMGAKGETMQC